VLLIIQKLLRILYSLAVSSALRPLAQPRLTASPDKYGQLGIWDARAPADEVADEDGDIAAPADDQERGKYWRLQPHWPATPKSSISTVKIDPIDSHSVSPRIVVFSRRKI
jgi:hypothetical protein